MTMEKLSDAEAKAIILDQWPRCPTGWNAGQGPPLVRAQPKESGATPRIRAVGTNAFRTQPDGMWVSVAQAGSYADAIVIESCGTVQNFNDKRSRYMPSLHSYVVDFPIGWLQHQPGQVGEHWKLLKAFSERPAGDLVVPTRFISVLFTVPNDIYDELRTNYVPAAHEYLCQHSSLGSYNSQKMQTLLGHLGIASHFYSGKP